LVERRRDDLRIDRDEFAGRIGMDLRRAFSDLSEL
jgi:hypothetical protein